MIKYNYNNINDWNLGDSNLIKVYRHNAICYYKVVAGETAQTPCYAVVNDITQYQDTEFENVFNKADNKWYKLNNLNQYEEYGVYGSGRTITTYEGKLTIDDGYEYIYSGDSWVNLGEVSGSTATLPNKSFVLNYNAKDYDSTSNSIPQTNGQTKEVDAICNYNPSNIIDHSSDGYISITGNTRLTISGGTTSLGRNNSQTGCTMTVVSKALTRNNYSLFTCRGRQSLGTLCWMYRQYSDYLLLCGKSNAPTLSCSSSDPSVLSIKTYYNNGVSSTVKNWSDNTTTSGSYEYYNNYDNGALFCDYLSNNDEFWQGDFYWVYMSQEVLSDEEIQQVIAYNEGSGGTPTYPMYYAVMQDPPTQVSFSSMTEAEQYECPYVGLMATINGDLYAFNDNYEWEAITFTLSGTTSSPSAFTLNININETPVPTQVFSNKWFANYTSPITVAQGMCSGNTALTSFDWGTSDTSRLTNITSAFSGCSSLTSIDIPNSVTSIGAYAFQDCTSLTSITIPSGVTIIRSKAFYGCTSLSSIDIPNSVTSIGSFAFEYCSSLTSCTIGSGVTSIDNFAFYGCSSLTSCTIGDSVTSIGGYSFDSCTSLSSITINATTPPTLVMNPFNNTNNCPIYVPSQSVETYKAASGWSSYASRIQAIP